MSRKIIGITVGTSISPEAMKKKLDINSGGNANQVDYVVQDTPPEDTSVLWVDPTDNTDDGFQEAVNTALAQAKASGEFDGADGQPGKDGADGAPGEKGEKGDTGAPGADGKDYVLTEADKTEIAGIAASLVDVPSGGGNVEKEWKLINEIRLTERAGTVSVTTDSDGNPFEVDEMYVISCLSSDQTGRKAMNFETNDFNGCINSYVKNSGYFGWGFLWFKLFDGKRRLDWSYSDACSTKPESIVSVHSIYTNATHCESSVFEIEPKKINKIIFKHENWGSCSFEVGSLFKIYGR